MKKVYGTFFAVITALIITLCGLTFLIRGWWENEGQYITPRQAYNEVLYTNGSVSEEDFSIYAKMGDGTQSADVFTSTRDVILPVVMYHSILKSREGVFIVSPTQLEHDFSAFIEYGYTSVFPSEVIAYVKGEGNLPQKPLMITFDDGLFNNLFYALPLLEKYDLKANMNIVGAYLDFYTESVDRSNPNYSYLTWAQIEEIVRSGRFEIGNHTYDMHKYHPRFGVLPKQGENTEVYAETLRADISLCQDKIQSGCGYRPVVFAYPYGKYTKTSNEIMKSMGFEMLLTCNEGINILKQGDIDALYRIKRVNRSGKFGTDTLIAKLRGAR